MKLEHRKQKVVSVKSYIKRIGKYNAFALALITFSVSVGTAGYHWICGLSWIDSIYMACMILTGMGPVTEMTSDGAKLFSSFYALYSGVAFLSVTAVFFAPIVHRLLHILHVDDEE